MLSMKLQRKPLCIFEYKVYRFNESFWISLAEEKTDCGASSLATQMETRFLQLLSLVFNTMCITKIILSHDRHNETKKLCARYKHLLWYTKIHAMVKFGTTNWIGHQPRSYFQIYWVSMTNQPHRQIITKN
jgi:hypothetical protein